MKKYLLILILVYSFGVVYAAPKREPAPIFNKNPKIQTKTSDSRDEDSKGPTPIFTAPKITKPQPQKTPGCDHEEWQVIIHNPHSTGSILQSFPQSSVSIPPNSSNAKNLKWEISSFKGVPYAEAYDPDEEVHRAFTPMPEEAHNANTPADEEEYWV